MGLTADQSRAKEKIEDFLQSGRQIFQLHGVAGSGKSTVLSQALGGRENIHFVAPTGKAAHVLRKKGIQQAKTLHSLIYKPVEVPLLDKNGKPRVNSETGEVLTRVAFSPRENKELLQGGGVVVVDEASMVSGQMAEHLLNYPVKVIAVGDPFQLPPIMSEGNRSLLDTGTPDVMLEEVHRSALESPVTALSRYVRNNGHLPHGEFSKNGSRILNSLRSYGGPVDVDRVQVIVGMNRTRHEINERVRRSRGIDPASLPTKGERVICRVNNSEYGVFNGMQLWVKDVHLMGVEGARLMEMESEEGEAIVAPVWLHGFFRNTDSKLNEMPMSQRKENLIVNFAYAITAHSSQGSEWDDVLVVDESRAFRGNAAKWLYTAVSRASERITVVKRL